MATAYYSPGVYIEEVNNGPRPIQGVSTSVTAFVGITEKAELVNEDGFTTRSLLSEPKLITNWTQYENHFGRFTHKAYLPYAVRGFFDNGGSTAWVISIHALNALPAQGIVYAANPRDAKKRGNAALLIHARDGGPIGNNISVTIQRERSSGQTTPPPPPTPSTPTGKESKESKEGDAPKSGNESAPPPPALPPAPAKNPLPPLAEDEFILRVEVKDEPTKTKEYTVKLADLPSWDARTAETNDVHKFEQVKVWSLTKETEKVVERVPVAGLCKLQYGAAKFDLALVDEQARTQLNGLPTETDENTILGNNAVQLFNGNAKLRKGAEGLEALDELNLICAPDLVLLHKERVITDAQLIGLQNGLLGFCQKTNYRFAILDAPYDRKLPEQILNWKQKPDQANFDSTHGALYYPWLNITDPLDGRIKAIPPCGHIAGIYARSDTQRGVHKAPANELVLGPVTSVTLNVTKGEQDLLNPVGINCIRAFPGRGIRIWGARTLSSDPAWRYINVRRLFNYVEESVERSMQWTVFEPNDVYLWAKVRRDITAFLRTVWRSGALFGVDPNQAFYVKCDEELNPAEIRDQGIMICEIGMAPVKPAEFVVFRFSQYALPSA